VLLLLFPNFASGEGEHSSMLALGQAMAAGGLLGDVFLHTIPHAQGGDDADVVGLWVLLGFTAFLVADMLLRSLSDGGGGHSHTNSAGSGHSNSKKDDHNHDQVKTSAILLNLAADAMHNFTDGLAIGASFSIASSSEQQHHHHDASVLSLLKSRGGLATLSILFHEIPHELGDFAVLVKNGYSKRQAIVAQFGTALAAMAGTVVGILLEGVFAGEALIYVTAGGFIYLAACTILPELLEERATLKFRLAQLVFFGAGIAFLYAVSYLEQMDGGGHGGHSHGHHQHGHSSEVVHHPPPRKIMEEHQAHGHEGHAHHAHDHHAQHAAHDHHDHHDHAAHHHEHEL
jgi:zinc transporter 7